MTDSPEPCTACEGGQTVTVPVRVGRARRRVGSQDGWCLRCFGTGTEPASCDETREEDNP
ncbi:hypothetical protein [Yinghuangia soli]|uniref:Uncharacterized protein n=1 Tax=Yinghuangia soli TaxID=2908204 RepID=A0AA41Q500_9ACTN|nr:hypothetical protein [Yinghuangia soli]MCF2531322.1 hypothetical protein [Yinghuangia soli]